LVVFPTCIVYMAMLTSIQNVVDYILQKVNIKIIQVNKNITLWQQNHYIVAWKQHITMSKWSVLVGF